MAGRSPILLCLVATCCAVTPEFPSRRDVFCPIKQSSISSVAAGERKMITRLDILNTMQDDAAEVFWVDFDGTEYMVHMLPPLADVVLETFHGAHFRIKRSTDQRVILEHTVGPEELHLPAEVQCDATKNTGIAGNPSYKERQPDQMVYGLVNHSPCDLHVSWRVPEMYRALHGAAEIWSGNLIAGISSPHFINTWIGHEFVVRLKHDNSLVKHVRPTRLEIMPCMRESNREVTAQATGAKKASLQLPVAPPTPHNIGSTNREVVLAGVSLNETQLHGPLVSRRCNGTAFDSMLDPSGVLVGTPMMSISKSLMTPASIKIAS